MSDKPLSIIAAAVEPQRADALRRAEEDARAVVKRYETLLAEHGWDASKAAPYPSGKLGRYDYEAAYTRYRTVRNLTVADGPPSYKVNGPEPVKMEPGKVAVFIEQARKDADAQYTAFIAKLEGKVGPCVAATLSGSHVWGYSFLTVTKEGDQVEVWKTQMIVNVSKLGNPYNQFPTRKVKR